MSQVVILTPIATDNREPDIEVGFRGVLWRSRGPWLVLRETDYIKARKGVVIEVKRLDGDVLLHRANLAYLQVPVLNADRQ